MFSLITMWMHAIEIPITIKLYPNNRTPSCTLTACATIFYRRCQWHILSAHLRAEKCFQFILFIWTYVNLTFNLKGASERMRVQHTLCKCILYSFTFNEINKGSLNRVSPFNSEKKLIRPKNIAIMKSNEVNARNEDSKQFFSIDFDFICIVPRHISN